jgi:hypothetical protein
MKRIVLGFVCFGFILSFVGCATIKQIHYKEKDDKRVSVIKDFTIYEKTSKKMKTENLFPVFKYLGKDEKEKYGGYQTSSIVIYLTVGWFVAVPAIDAIITPFIALYAVTIGEKNIVYEPKTTINLLGRLVDEQEKGLAKTEISYISEMGYVYNKPPIVGTTITDDNGLFNKLITVNNYARGIKLQFDENMSTKQESFKRGEHVKILNPIQIKYTIISDEVIKTEGDFIVESIGDKDSFDTLETIVKPIDWNSDKIILTEQEFYSEKNGKLTIAELEKANAEKIAEEKAEAQQREYYKHHHVGHLGTSVLYQIATGALYQVDTGEYIVETLMEVIQVSGNKGFLAKCFLDTMTGQGFFVYVTFKNTSKLYEGMMVLVDGKILGTYTYQTRNGGTNTVPKVNASKVQDFNNN